jgi:hypothetical protein
LVPSAHAPPLSSTGITNPAPLPSFRLPPLLISELPRQSYPARGASTSRIQGSASRLRHRRCIPQVSWHPSFLFLLALPLRFINLELALCLVSVVLDPCEIGLKIRFSWSHWPAGRPCASGGGLAEYLGGDSLPLGKSWVTTFSLRLGWLA